MLRLAHLLTGLFSCRCTRTQTQTHTHMGDARTQPPVHCASLNMTIRKPASQMPLAKLNVSGCSCQIYFSKHVREMA